MDEPAVYQIGGWFLLAIGFISLIMGINASCVFVGSIILQCMAIGKLIRRKNER